jgi:hypothetical protein
MRLPFWSFLVPGLGALAALALSARPALLPAGAEPGAPEPGEGEDVASLTRAVRTAASLENYTFRAETEGGAPAAAVEGKYQKGRPVWFRSDGIEFFRDGEALAYRQGDRWLRSKTGIESDPLPVLGAAARVRAARLPHRELDRLDRHLRDVRRVAGKESAEAVYAATLDDEAVKWLAPSERRMVARDGTARLTVGKDGRVVRYEVRIRLLGRLGDAEVDGALARSVTISTGGNARVEVPEGAVEALR